MLFGLFFLCPFFKKNRYYIDNAYLNVFSSFSQLLNNFVHICCFVTVQIHFDYENTQHQKKQKSNLPLHFCRRAHERPPPHPHRMHPNYGHGHHIHVPQTMSSHPRQPEQRTAWSVSCSSVSFSTHRQVCEAVSHDGHPSLLSSFRHSSTGSWELRRWPPTLRQGTCTPTCTIITQPPDCTISPFPSW